MPVIDPGVNPFPTELAVGTRYFAEGVALKVALARAVGVDPWNWHIRCPFRVFLSIAPRDGSVKGTGCSRGKGKKRGNDYCTEMEKM